MQSLDTAQDVEGGRATHDGGPVRQSLPALSLAALGVVYGDIGTSPLYAFREAMAAAGGNRESVEAANVLGILSLITWALILIVTIKYVLILMRASNQGEGGILSLLALLQRVGQKPAGWVTGLALLGAALFYGDAIITPAVSVVSAVEGLELLTMALEPWVLPIAIGIICILFLMQHRGTDAVARYFGPLTLLWFVVMGVGGLSRIIDSPEVLKAFDPRWGIGFLDSNATVSIAILGAVFLAVTGAEALYADMGHFGRKPIQLAWFTIVLPCLLLNYYGQGALVLQSAETMSNPFFLLFPKELLGAVVVLAAVATVIASQAVISGAFSLTKQAIQLRFLPRMRIRHTSDEQQGQIYIPAVNAWMLIGVVALILGFGSSSALASAYGISVTGTMVITASLSILVAHRVWRFPLWLSILAIAPFLTIEGVFFGANLSKINDGGWLPLTVAAAIIVIMLSWRRGSDILLAKEQDNEMPIADLVPQLDSTSISKIKGTAIYLSPHPDHVPGALLHTLKHFRAMHEHTVLLTVVTENVPRLADKDRVEMRLVTDRLRQIIVHYGYVEDPDIPHALMLCRKMGWRFDIMTTSFIFSRRNLRLSTRSKMPRWQSRLFIALGRNAADASEYFRIPAGRVVELGAQLNI